MRIINALQGQPADKEVKDAPPGNRLNAVIEKIERLYVVCILLFTRYIRLVSALDLLNNYYAFQGKQSDDEEDLNDFPDDDEYDTEDSFIDDTELVGHIKFLNLIYLIQICVILYPNDLQAQSIFCNFVQAASICCSQSTQYIVSGYAG